jgi:hypothetical protein
MKKAVKWSLVIVLVLLLAGGLILYLSLNGIIRSQIEKQSTQSLELRTQLAAARLSLFGGTLNLDDLQIASPSGYPAPQMFTMDDAHVAVRYGELRQDPVRISELRIKGPTLMLEHAGGKFNIQALMDLPSPAEEPTRLIIGKLDITDAAVVLRPGLPELAQEIRLALPPLQLTNVGTGEGAENGAAIKQVVMEVLTAMAAKAAESDQLPEHLRQLLALDVNKLAAQLGDRFQAELDKVTTDVFERLKGELPADLQPAIRDVVGERAPDVGKAVEEGLGGLLNRKKSSTPPPPAQSPDD